MTLESLHPLFLAMCYKSDCPHVPAVETKMAPWLPEISLFPQRPLQSLS